MDLNHVLVWLTGITVISWLVALVRNHGVVASSWLVTTALVLVLWIAGVFMWPDLAGYITLAVWFTFLLVPQLGTRAIQALSIRGRYRAALWIARLLAVLHPSAQWRRQPRALLALALLQAGKGEAAERVLVNLARSPSSLGVFAELQRFRARWQWRELIDWVEARADRDALALDPAVIGHYLRARGETGDLEGMARGYVQFVHPRPVPMREAHQIYVAALAGHVDAVDHLLEGALRPYGPEMAAFWRGTALWARGEEASAKTLLEPLLRGRDHIVRAGAKARLSRGVTPVARDGEGQAEVVAQALQLIDADLERVAAARERTRAEAVVPWMTYSVVGVEVAAFLREIPGGTTNPENLLALGAMLGPLELLQGEWWRLLTAGFLHYGWLHLVLNSLGILLFGRRLEREIGPWRFLAIYLLTSVGSLAAILGWSEFISHREFVLVGASASLMGIVGASGAVSVRRYWTSRSPQERAWLMSLGLIIAVQTAFDLSTPQVSVAAHLGGVVIGLVLGLVFAPTTPYYRARAAAILARPSEES